MNQNRTDIVGSSNRCLDQLGYHPYKTRPRTSQDRLFHMGQHGKVVGMGFEPTPTAYETVELPDCSTPRQNAAYQITATVLSPAGSLC